MATGPADQTAVAPDGYGHMRTSLADREQAIDTLKAAYVQGRLTKDELDERVGRALVAADPRRTGLAHRRSPGRTGPRGPAAGGQPRRGGRARDPDGRRDAGRPRRQRQREPAARCWVSCCCSARSGCWRWAACSLLRLDRRVPAEPAHRTPGTSPADGARRAYAEVGAPGQAWHPSSLAARSRSGTHQQRARAAREPGRRSSAPRPARVHGLRPAAPPRHSSVTRISRPSGELQLELERVGGAERMP